jgi:glycolate oxidase FAD binding subunit
VVKSVTGYDIPKLLVGSLGTLGILVEATLRLHPLPEAEATWLATFATAEGARGFLARVLDGALQPNRLEILNGPVQGGRSDGSLTVAISFGSVADAVKSQGESATALAHREGGQLQPAEPGFWSRLGDALARAQVLLKIATLASETAALAGEVERLGLDLGMTTLVVGEAGNGVLHAGLAGPLVPERWGADLVARLRERVAAHGGSVVVERAPREVKDRLDVWGPLDPGVLAIMKRLKAEFDPLGVLNPGRFVDGI